MQKFSFAVSFFCVVYFLYKAMALDFLALYFCVKVVNEIVVAAVSAFYPFEFLLLLFFNYLMKGLSERWN